MHSLLPHDIRITQLSDEGPIPSFFIRFRDPIASLTNNWNYVRADDPDADQIVAAAHVLVVQRSFTARSKRLVTRAKAAGTLVIYETDDLMLALSPQSRCKITEGQKDAIRWLIAEADVVTCSTLALAESLSKFNPNVHVLENYSVPMDMDAIRAARDKTPHLCIVNTDYFKLTRAPDEFFSALHEAIQALGYECSSFGSIDPLMAQLASEFPSKVRLHTNFINWRKNFLHYLMSKGVNVAMVPLEDDAHHRFKSDVKFADFASIGVAGIYNHPRIYPRVIHRENGFVCDGTYRGWLDGLEYFADESTRNRCGDAAYQDALNRTLATYAAEFAALIRSSGRSKSSLAAVPASAEYRDPLVEC